MLHSARLVRAARVLAGLSQAELAAEAEVGLNTLRLLEQGNSTPREATLALLTDALAKKGVTFLPASRGRAAGLALAKDGESSPEKGGGRFRPRGNRPGTRPARASKIPT